MNVSFLKIDYRIESDVSITLPEGRQIAWGEIRRSSKNHYAVTIVLKNPQGNVLLKKSFSAMYEVKNFFYSLQKKLLQVEEKRENGVLPGQLKIV